LATVLLRKPLSPEQQSRFYELILQSCQSSKGIINELLEMARYD
jgi:signal transduction histidine kinase